MTGPLPGMYQGTLRKKLALTDEPAGCSAVGAERSVTIEGGVHSMAEGRARAFAILKRDSPVENPMCWEVKHEMFLVSVEQPPGLEPVYPRPVS